MFSASICGIESGKDKKELIQKVHPNFGRVVCVVILYMEHRLSSGQVLFVLLSSNDFEKRKDGGCGRP